MDGEQKKSDVSIYNLLTSRKGGGEELILYIKHCLGMITKNYVRVCIVGGVAVISMDGVIETTSDKMKKMNSHFCCCHKKNDVSIVRNLYPPGTCE